MIVGYASILVVGFLCLFWIFIFGRAFYRSVSKGKEKTDQHSGRIVTGKIISAKPIGKGAVKRMTIDVEFPNFSNSEVRETFIFTDTKPQENRYEEGKNIQLILSDKENNPSVRLAEGKSSGGGLLKFIVFCLFAGSVYGTFILYQLIDREIGGDWSSLPFLDNNPAVYGTGGIFVLTMVFMYFMFRALKLLPSKKRTKQEKILKLYGQKVMADITNVETTGTTINDNPVIRFYYSFKDRFGTEHKGEDKLLMDALQLATAQSTTQREVLYMPEAPSNSRLMDALKSNFMGGCILFIFLFICLVFTAVVVGGLLAELLVF